MKSSKKRTKRRSGISNRNLIMIVLCAALLTAGIVLLFFSLFAIYKVYDIPMSVRIANVSGMNTDTDHLNFGRAVPGSSNTRVIVMSHAYKRPLLIHFKKSGNISRFVDVPQDFYLEPNVAKEVSLNAIIPQDLPYNSYEGKLTVYFRRI
jgi:hypothetical protein